ncbi:MAG: response regulator [Bryobacteraceae bacterium]|jgi:two-component system chemotaxis response regulator CheY
MKIEGLRQTLSLDDESAADYLSECREYLAAVGIDLLTMEKSGAPADEEVVNRVFRSVHCIKGGASFFDLVKIRELAHRTEDVLALMRSRKMAPNPERMRVLLAAAATLSQLIDNPRTSNQADTAAVMAALAQLCADRRVSAGLSAVAALATGRSRPLRLLLVEDDFASRRLLQTFLTRYGECHVAVNGREAVDAVRSAFDCGQRYDLICMDITMPEMDGREAVRQVRALEEIHGILSTAGAKIVMTTTVRDIGEVMQCFRELCDAYLMKPIDVGKLLDQMQAFGLTR